MAIHYFAIDKRRIDILFNELPYRHYYQMISIACDCLIISRRGAAGVAGAELRPVYAIAAQAIAAEMADALFPAMIYITSIVYFRQAGIYIMTFAGGFEYRSSFQYHSHFWNTCNFAIISQRLFLSTYRSRFTLMVFDFDFVNFIAAASVDAIKKHRDSRLIIARC